MTNPRGWAAGLLLVTVVSVVWAQSQSNTTQTSQPVAQAEAASSQTTTQQGSAQRSDSLHATGQRSAATAQSTDQSTTASQTAQPRRRVLTTRDALQMYREGRYQDAVDETLAEIQETPRNLDSYVVLGWSLLALGRYQDALSWATKALNLAPEDERVIEILGEASYRLGHDQEALKYFQEFVRITHGVADRLVHYVYYFMGEIYIHMNELNHADIALSTAVHFEPNDPVYWMRLGYVNEKLKNYAHALEDYTRAIALKPNYQEAVIARNRVQALIDRG